MPYLEIKLGPDTLLLRFVGRIDYVFGRLPRADIQLRDMKVSRLHTQCFIDSRGNAFVRDLGSSGGTYINNQRMRHGVIAPLSNGLKFRVGDAAMTFYDQDPPVNAMDPPCQSNPRGLIRTNPRQRHFEAEATVLAMNKVEAETQSGPAEPPPEINPADFADGPGDFEQKPAPQKPASAVQQKPPAQKPASAPQPKPPAKPTRRDTGIVEAPWEKAKPQAPTDKRVTIPPPTRGGKQAPPPPMQTADIDEMGQFHAPAAQAGASGKPPTAKAGPPKQPSPLPPRQPQPPAKPQPAKPPAKPAPEPFFTDELDAVANTSREPAIPDVEAFKPPPPITGAMKVDDEEEAPKQRVGMPTVRLERPAILDRQKQIEKEEAEAAAALRIPTASVKPPETAAPAAPVDETEPAPQIGVAPSNREQIKAADEADFDEPAEDPANTPSDDDPLTDEQISEYLGGSVSGRYGDVDFGDKPKAEDESEKDEVSFGTAAQAGMAADADIDLDDEPAADAPPAEQPAAHTTEAAPAQEMSQPEEFVPEADSPQEQVPVEPTTSMLGATTAVKEEVIEPADIAGAAPPPAEEDDTSTPPPVTREGATEDKTFKPRKTRKLMKRRKETGKITDRSNPTPLPEGAKTQHVPVPADLPVIPGAKTMFIPKPDEARRDGPGLPDRPTGKPKAVPENRERKTMQEMAEGPGGDTVAMPPEMMKQLQEELKKQYAKKKDEPTIGDNPTVKLAGDEDHDEFVLDEDYAFFTPPPATRKAREAAAKAAAAPSEGEVINANDFNKETDNLPPDKKAKSKGDPDTLLE